jgi:hypothetical protein
VKRIVEPRVPLGDEDSPGGMRNRGLGEHRFVVGSIFRFAFASARCRFPIAWARSLSVAEARAFPTAIAPENPDPFAIDAPREKLQTKWKQQNDCTIFPDPMVSAGPQRGAMTVRVAAIASKLFVASPLIWARYLNCRRGTLLTQSGFRLAPGWPADACGKSLMIVAYQAIERRLPRVSARPGSPATRPFHT